MTLSFPSIATLLTAKSSLAIQTGLEGIDVWQARKLGFGAWPNLAVLKVDDLGPVIVVSQLSNLVQRIGCMISGSSYSGMLILELVNFSPRRRISQSRGLITVAIVMSDSVGLFLVSR